MAEIHITTLTLLDMFRLLFCLKHTELLTIISFPLVARTTSVWTDYTQVVSAQIYNCFKCPLNLFW